MRDHSLDTLLDLDGTTFFSVEGQGYWVKFDVKRVATSAERPHGLKYSLTLHDPKNRRIVGFDNAHEIATGFGPGKKKILNGITSIVLERSSRTTMRMLRRCSQISGRK